MNRKIFLEELGELFLFNFLHSFDLNGNGMTKMFPPVLEDHNFIRLIHTQQRVVSHDMIHTYINCIFISSQYVFDKIPQNNVITQSASF